MLKKIKKNRLFKFLASLKLAVILLVALAGILATATFYESLYDTKTAQYLVYRSPLFALFLTVLGINLLFSTFSRYPWRKSQTGFVITHLGIIIILMGSLQTMFLGVDGSMALEEGERSSRIMIDEPVLYFGRTLESLQEISAEYRWSPPSPGKTEYRYTLSDDDHIVAVIDDYYHHAQSESIYVPSKVGMPALELRLSNEMIDQNLWLTPAVGSMDLGPASLSFNRLPDQTAVEIFSNGVSNEERGKIQLLINENAQEVDLNKLIIGKPFPLEFEGATLELVRYLPHAIVEDGQLVSKTDEPVNPAVELKLSMGEAVQEWLLFSALPDLDARMGSIGEEFDARMLYLHDGQSSEHSFEVGLTPEGQLLYRVDGQPAQEIAVGDKIKTGWMDLEAELLQYHPVATKKKLMNEVFPKKTSDETAPGPAIRLQLEGAELAEPLWLERGDIRKVEDRDGEEIYIGYGYKTVVLPFTVELKEFRIGFDPGTQNAATYESDVVVEDEVYTIAMNEPLDRDGYKLFQASFSESAGGVDISVFSVARDPGITLKYFGSIMLILGIIIMFYFKPKKKKTARKKVAVEAGANLED